MAEDVKALRKAYEDLAAQVEGTLPNTPERARIMKQKKDAFTKFHQAEEDASKATPAVPMRQRQDAVGGSEPIDAGTPASKAGKAKTAP